MYCKGLSFLVAVLGVFCLGQCSSSPSRVLEQWTKGGKAPSDDVNSVNSPAYRDLVKQLASRGYQGVGLQFESQHTLKLLYEVFSDPKTADRRLKLIYTGLNLSYDRAYQSVTIGGTDHTAEIIAYIQKHVPPRKRRP